MNSLYLFTFIYNLIQANIIAFIIDVEDLAISSISLRVEYLLPYYYY